MTNCCTQRRALATWQLVPQEITGPISSLVSPSASAGTTPLVIAARIIGSTGRAAGSGNGDIDALGESEAVMGEAVEGGSAACFKQ